MARSIIRISALPWGAAASFAWKRAFLRGWPPLLTALERNGLSATFFVEAMQTCHFGNCEMSRVIDYVRKKDCLVDLQLHLHPEWKMLDNADWRTRVKTVRKNGSMAGRGSEARDMIIDGYHRFISLTGEIPVALRTGGLNVDLNVLRLQQEIGLPLSSSVGIGIYQPIESELNLLGGLKHFGATTDIPVFSFALNMAEYEFPRLLTIIGNSFRTLQGALEWAYARQISPLTLLTDASEFAREAQDDPIEPTYAANPVVHRRWSRLCAYLSENRARFRTVTFRESLSSWSERNDNHVPTFSRSVLAELTARTLEHTHALFAHR